jgi:hypothetical protein
MVRIAIVGVGFMVGKSIPGQCQSVHEPRELSRGLFGRSYGACQPGLGKV